MRMRVFLKKVGEPLKIVNTTEKYRTDAAKEFLGNVKCEFVYLNNDNRFVFVCDEDGMTKQLKPNFLIETEAIPVMPILGDVIFIRTKPVNHVTTEIWDFEVEDIRPSDIDYVKKMLDRNYQMELFYLYAKGV